MASKVFWQEVLEKYSSYEGSVTKFCQEQSISKSQYYYHKRMLHNDNNKFVFQAVTLNEREIIPETSIVKPSTNIEIKVGKVSISIPTSETNLIKVVVEEILKLC
ncbi:MAG: hypothetical protein MR691_00655 [Clostridium sp.]|nr:hypothetical protein [Clostridium sp.]